MAYRPIRNSAQLAPAAIEFKRRPPAADLASSVLEFWQYDVRAPHDWVPNQVFPSGCTVIRFNIAPSFVEPIVYGPSLRGDMKGVFARGVSAFGAALTLEHARMLIGCEMSELRDLRLDLRLLWRDPLDSLCETLWLAGGF